MKICIKCDINKEFSAFNKRKNSKDGLRNTCKICEANYKKINYQQNKQHIINRVKKWRENNPQKKEEYKETIQKYSKKYNIENNEEIKKKAKLYRENNKESRKKYSKIYNIQYYKKYSNKIIKSNYKYKKNKLKNDNLFRISENIRSAISTSIRRFGYTKKSKTYAILCCTFEEFKSYIESKFEHWMSWENYGKYNGEFKYGWDFDHIIPISNANTEEEIIKLNHYTNFQPLDSKINRDIKKNRTDFDISEVVNYNIL